MKGEQRRELKRLLAEVYRPEGVAIWLSAVHRQWGMTVDEMFAAGRGQEVIDRAAQLADGAFA